MPPLPEPQDVDLVLYHASCQDGFTAAWAAWKVLGERAKYIPVQYGQDPPNVEGQNVAIVDFSYKRKTMEKVVSQAKSLVVLDHHKTAKEELGLSYRPMLFVGTQEFDLTSNWEAARNALLDVSGSVQVRRETKIVDPLPYAIFDMNKAGCLLTWEWFHPGVEPPKIVKYANDRDLWRFELKNTNAVHAALSLHSFDFETWDRLANQLEDDEEAIVQSGQVVCEHIRQIAKRLCKHAVLIEVQGVRMWALNYAGTYTSDVGQILREKVSDDGSVPGVALIWFYKAEDGTFKCSLRSAKDSADVSVIAKAMDPTGGGHRNAAGFTFDGDIRSLIKPV